MYVLAAEFRRLFHGGSEFYLDEKTHAGTAEATLADPDIWEVSR